MARPLVSVVIPTRDRADLLRGAVESALAQDYPEIEVIVVDDGSRDETASVVADLRHSGSVRALRNETSVGAAAARNRGAEAAEGDLLLFEDDDCRSEPGRVEKLVAALESDPDAGYAYGRGRYLDVEGRAVLKGTEGPWAIGTPAALIRSTAFDAVGGFDPELPRLQDFDLWARILARYRTVEVPEVLFRTVRDAEGISASTARLVDAAGRLTAKYADSKVPPRHWARMHRYLGGALLVRGVWGQGLRHLLRAVRLRPTGLRGWLALAAGVTGPRGYRSALRLRGGGPAADVRGSGEGVDLPRGEP